MKLLAWKVRPLLYFVRNFLSLGRVRKAIRLVLWIRKETASEKSLRVRSCLYISVSHLYAAP